MRAFDFEDLRLSQIAWHKNVWYMILGDSPYGGIQETATIITSEGKTYRLPGQSGNPRATGFHLRMMTLAESGNRILVACDGLHLFDIQTGFQYGQLDAPPSVAASYDEYYEWLEQRKIGRISTHLSVREAYDDHHVVMTGSLFASRLPLLFGPSRAVEIMGKRSTKSNHLLQWSRGGTPRVMKLEANPLHVALAGDGTFWAFSRRMAWQIDLDD